MDAMTETQSTTVSVNTEQPTDVFFISTTRQLLERGQNATRSLMDLNVEVISFLNQRVSRNSEAVGHVMQCRNLPELLDAETAWVRQAFDDYAGEASRLMAFNARLIGCAAPIREDGESTRAAARPSGKPRQAIAAGVMESA